jgi:hypothetical protein
LPRFLVLSWLVEKISWPVLFSWSPSTRNSQWILLVWVLVGKFECSQKSCLSSCVAALSSLLVSGVQSWCQFLQSSFFLQFFFN